MEDVLGSDDEYTPQRYEAALKGEEYALVKSGGVVELGELYRPMNGTKSNGMNERARGTDALTVPIRTIEGRVAEEELPA